MPLVIEMPPATVTKELKVPLFASTMFVDIVEKMEFHSPGVARLFSWMKGNAVSCEPLMRPP